jgi:hypothetical protein
VKMFVTVGKIELIVEKTFAIIMIGNVNVHNGFHVMVNNVNVAEHALPETGNHWIMT